jgi:hypothetical protein
MENLGHVPINGHVLVWCGLFRPNRKQRIREPHVWTAKFWCVTCPELACTDGLPNESSRHSRFIIQIRENTRSKMLKDMYTRKDRRRSFPRWRGFSKRGGSISATSIEVCFSVITEKCSGPWTLHPNPPTKLSLASWAARLAGGWARADGFLTARIDTFGIVQYSPRSAG